MWCFQGCRPYSIAECEHYMNGTRPPCKKLPTPTCVQQCDSGYKLAYDDDKHFGRFITVFHHGDYYVFFSLFCFNTRFDYISYSLVVIYGAFCSCLFFAELFSDILTLVFCIEFAPSCACSLSCFCQVLFGHTY